MMHHTRLFRIALGHSAKGINNDVKSHKPTKTGDTVWSPLGVNVHSREVKQLAEGLNPRGYCIMNICSTGATGVMKYLIGDSSAAVPCKMVNIDVNTRDLYAQAIRQQFRECNTEIAMVLMDMANQEPLNSIRPAANRNWENTDRSKGHLTPQARKLPGLRSRNVQPAPTRFAHCDLVDWGLKTLASKMLSPEGMGIFITSAIELRNNDLKSNVWSQAKVGFRGHIMVECDGVGNLTPHRMDTVVQDRVENHWEIDVGETSLQKASHSGDHPRVHREFCNELDKSKKKKTDFVPIRGEIISRLLHMTSLNVSSLSTVQNSVQIYDECRQTNTLAKSPNGKNWVGKGVYRHSYSKPLGQGNHPSKVDHLWCSIDPISMRKEMQMHPQYSCGEQRNENGIRTVGSTTWTPSQIGFQRSMSRHHSLGRAIYLLISPQGFVSVNVRGAKPERYRNVTCGWGAKQVRNCDEGLGHAQCLTAQTRQREFATNGVYGRSDRISPVRRRARRQSTLINKLKMNACARGISPDLRTEKGENNVKCN